MITGVPAADIPPVVDRLLPFLTNFADRSLGRWTVDSLLGDIIARDRQVWNINDFQAVCLTSITAECVHIDACSGVRRHEWQEELDAELRKWAQALGKKRIIALVRPGWAKFGKERGYRETHREFVKEL